MTSRNRTDQPGGPMVPEKDRRAWRRQPASAVPFLKSAGLVGGPEVRLRNISRGGALLETEEPMVPGSAICIRLVAADVMFLLRGHVLRSRASKLLGPALRYEASVAFDDGPPCPMHGMEQAKEAEAVRRGKPAADDRGVEIVTALVPSSGPDLRQIFGLNHW